MIFDSQKQLLFTPIYSDTVYQIESEMSIYPKYVIKQEKSIWEKCDSQMEDSEICRLIKEDNYTKFTGDFMSSDTYVFFTIERNHIGFILKQPYIWDKTTGNIYRWDVVTKNENLSDFIAPPKAVYNNNFYGILQFNGDPKLKKISPELSKILKSCSEDSNPIIVSYEIGSLH